MVFPVGIGEKRTNDSFRSRIDPRHHKGDSLFEKTELDMVSVFVIDPMHTIDSGVTKRLFMLLFLMKRGKARLVPSVTNIVHERLKVVRKFASSDFHRKLESLNDLLQWKATMYRSSGTYFLPILFKGVLPNSQFNHLMYYYVALRILRNPILVKSEEHLLTAQNYLEFFVEKYCDFYGEEQRVFCVHNLMHVTEDCQRLGKTLDEFSCYCMEDTLRKLVLKVRSKSKIAAELYRRLTEDQIVCAEQKFKCVPEFKKDKRGRITAVKTKLVNLKIDSDNDGCVVLKDRNVIKLNSVSTSGQCQGTLFKRIGDFFSSPLRSSHLGIEVVEKLEDSVWFHLEDIAMKVTIIPCEGELISIPLLHSIGIEN